MKTILVYFAGVAMGIAISILATHSAHAFAPGSPLHAANAVSAKKHDANRAADSGACYNVNDSDARAYCLAKARQEPSVCYSIQRADLRSMCLAEVRR